MAPGNTGTGGVLEQMIIPALKRGNYQHQAQLKIGVRLGGGRHIVDVLATDGKNQQFLISLKWQQVGGTAEQKVPFEAICLAEAIRTSGGKFHKAYIVLGGEGWSLRDFYLRGGLDAHLTYGNLVSFESLESFVAKANQGKL